MNNGRYSGGFTLIELLLAVFLSTLLITAIVQLVTANVSSYRLQLSQSQLQESSQYAREVLVSHISQAGHQFTPWNIAYHLSAITNDAVDNFSTHGDQLGLQRLSRQNCYGNDNPTLDAQGLPASWLLQAKFKVTDSNNLSMTCRYGADSTQLVTQMNNFGLVEDVESMQVLYAEDVDNDWVADGWVHASQWQQETGVNAIKIGLLLASHQSFSQRSTRQITLLDETFMAPADGRLRKVSFVTSAIRGRLQ